MAVAYFNTDGKCVSIVANTSTPKSLTDDIPYCAVLAEGIEPRDIFYDSVDDNVKLRASYNTLVDGNTIRNIPAGTTAVIGSESYVIDDGSLTVEANLSSLVPVILHNVRYKDTIVEVRT